MTEERLTQIEARAWALVAEVPRESGGPRIPLESDGGSLVGKGASDDPGDWWTVLEVDPTGELPPKHREAMVRAIVAAPSDLLDLVAEVRRMGEERDHWRDHCKEVEAACSTAGVAPVDPSVGRYTEHLVADLVAEVHRLRSSQVGVCPCCGIGVRLVDEEGGCITCGEDLIIAADQHSAELVWELARRERALHAEARRLRALLRIAGAKLRSLDVETVTVVGTA